MEFRPEAAHVVGIDAGGTSLRVEIADLAGRLVARSSLTLRGRRDASAIVKAIAEAVRASAKQVDAKPIAAAAGVSGIVDAAGGTVLLSPDLPGLNGQNVAELLARRLGMPVAIDNDDLLAAAGEAAFGAAEGCTEVVFLSLGLGLGAGLLVGGGRSAASGPRRGRSRTSPRARSRTSPRASRSPAATTSAAASAPARRGGRPSAIIEFAAGRGCRMRRAVIDDAIDALGALAVNVGALLDPEVIVLGGGLARGIPSLVEALAARLHDALPFPPRVVLSELGEDAVARGAGSLALSLGQRQLAGVTAEPGRLGALEFV